MISAFEGNRAETKTMLPVIEAFMTALLLLERESPGVEDTVRPVVALQAQ